MKNIKILLFPALLFILMSCKSATDCNQMLQDIQDDLESGNLREAIHLADSLKKCCAYNNPAFQKADSLAQIAERIGLDFSVSEEQIIKQIEKRSGSFSRSEWLHGKRKGGLNCG